MILLTFSTKDFVLCPIYSTFALGFHKTTINGKKKS